MRSININTSIVFYTQNVNNSKYYINFKCLWTWKHSRSFNFNLTKQNTLLVHTENWDRNNKFARYKRTCSAMAPGVIGYFESFNSGHPRPGDPTQGDQFPALCPKGISLLFVPPQTRWSSSHGEELVRFGGRTTCTPPPVCVTLTFSPMTTTFKPESMTRTRIQMDSSK